MVFVTLKSIPILFGIIIVAVVVAIMIIMLVVIPISAPHNPETVEWLNQAECAELKDWIESKKGTLEKYQSTAKGIYDFKGCE